MVLVLVLALAGLSLLWLLGRGSGSPQERDDHGSAQAPAPVGEPGPTANGPGQTLTADADASTRPVQGTPAEGSAEPAEPAGEARERLLAAAGGNDAIPVALERVGEQLLYGVLVVDEEDRLRFGHVRGRATPERPAPRLL